MKRPQVPRRSRLSLWWRYLRWQRVRFLLWTVLAMLFWGLIATDLAQPNFAASPGPPNDPAAYPSAPVSPSPSPSIEPLPSGSATPQGSSTTQPPSPWPPIPSFTPPVGVPSQARIPNRFYSQIIRQVAVAPNRKLIALTFDDGPWPKITPKVLEILKQHQIKATFFMIGRHLRLHPEIAQQVVAAGHGVGNHSWSHPLKSEPIEIAEIIAEIENTTVSLKKITGLRTDLFRPPGGHLENGLVDYAHQKKYLTVMWTIDPADTKPEVTAQQISDHVLKQAKPGSIILLHDGGGDRSRTLTALPKIITGLKAQGYTFVSVNELLAFQQQPSPTPSPTSSTSPVAQPGKPGVSPTGTKPKPTPTSTSKPTPKPTPKPSPSLPQPSPSRPTSPPSPPAPSTPTIPEGWSPNQPLPPESPEDGSF
jgi:peptidoglycan-N-acetylglucosamine deacetylase